MYLLLNRNLLRTSFVKIDTIGDCGALQKNPINELLDQKTRNLVVRTVKKRRRNIVLQFSHDSVTTACLKTYNALRAICAQQVRHQMGRDRQGRAKNKKSKKELGGERREERIDQGAGEAPSAREKKIVSPRSTADSELWRSGDSLRTHQR
ncbi:hypothetical protein TNCV_1383081 [Trichonephila clavipes]|nr:hypothetical protein TNCV_1383081 [Trichonephila clavipes]